MSIIKLLRYAANSGVPSLVLLFVVNSVLGAKPELANRLREISEAGAAHARRLDSVEFLITSHEKYDIAYMHDGAKFRLEYWDKGVDRKTSTATKIVSYDGEHYWQLQPDDDELGRASILRTPRLLPVTNSPLFVPYYWLLESQKNYTWSTICDQKAWQSALDSAELIRDTEVDGRKCIEVVLSFPKAFTSIAFLPEPNCLPIAWTCRAKEGDAVLSECKVIKYETTVSEDEPLVIPIESQYQQAGNGVANKWGTKSQLLPASLKVNAAIDDDLFTLSPTHTTEIIDVDQRWAEQSGDALESNGGNSWLIAANVVVVAVFSLLILARRRVIWKSM